MYLKVETHDDANKLSELLKDGDWLVLYYAEWCGHCKAMKPEWEKVVEKLKDSSKINIADIKSELIEALSHKPKIEGFPTIKMYNKGREIAKYEDERSAGKIQQFAISNANSNNKKTAIKIAVKNAINTVLQKFAEKDTVNKANTIQLEKLSTVPEPIAVVDNSNEVKKLNLSQLKDEIITKIKANTVNNNIIEIKNENNQVKKTIASKKQVENMGFGDLNMLLQPPVPSAKASKKPEFMKNKTQRKTQKNAQKNASVKVIVNNKRNNKVPTNYYDSLACSEIKKAKWCKTNPKCVYDYIEFKCKDKSTNRPAPKHNIINSNKGTNKSKKTQKQTKNQRQNQTITKENGTKAILQELHKSFKKISDEAKKDSNLLAKASERI
jgi:protein disulfide-isomerase-like protein